MYIRPLQNADPPIIPHDRLGDFMQNVFYNWAELHSHHRRLLDTLYEIQREEHPRIRSVTAPVFDGALNFREAYMEYIPNYPIAEYRIEDEMKRNPIFKEFAEVCSIQIIQPRISISPLPCHRLACSTRMRICWI
jgi:hypothetical protein